MRERRSLMWILVVLMPLASLAMVSVPVRSSPSPVTFSVDMPDGYIPGKPVGTTFYVDIYVNASDLVMDSPEAIAGWGIDVSVDPTVLKPLRVKGARSGYFLWDFADEYWYDYPTLLVGSIDTETGYIDDITEMIMPTPPGGAATPLLGIEPYLLVSIEFESLSETDYTLIDIIQPEYKDCDGFWHTVVDEDGHYNPLPVVVHDINITEVTIPAPEVEVGEPVYITVTVLNEGNISESFDVAVSYDETLIGTETVVLAAGESTSILFTWETADVAAGTYTLTAEAIVDVDDDPTDNTKTTNITVKEVVLVPPVASFTSSPEYPIVGENVTFDASASYDDVYIISYAWNFGDGTNGTSVQIDHVYDAAGDYTVTLTVTDNDGLTDTETAYITVGVVHDIAITGVTAYPTEVTSGEPVSINVTVDNEGIESETFNVTAYANTIVIGIQTVTDLAPNATTTVTFTWDTADIAEGNYTINAVATVAEDKYPADNEYVDGSVKVTQPAFPTEPVIAIVGVAAVIGASILFFIKRRKS